MIRILEFQNIDMSIFLSKIDPKYWPLDVKSGGIPIKNAFSLIGLNRACFNVVSKMAIVTSL